MTERSLYGQRALRALVYGDVNLNLIDGSAVWLASTAECLARSGVEVTVLLKARIETDRLLRPLLALPGVGRKTANLTLTAGFGLPGICVDVHVHRICNRWGYVATSDPDATELVLRRILPAHHWAEINRLLVAFGQNLCLPRSPHCERCPVSAWCARRGVMARARR